MTDIIGSFFQFFEEKDTNGESYASRFEKMIDSDERRLLINIDDIRGYDSRLCDALLHNPIKNIERIEDEINRRANGKSTKFAQSSIDAPFHIGFYGSFGSQAFGPRELGTHCLTQLVSVEGIVTKVSLVRPKLRRSVHYCPEGDDPYFFKDYVDSIAAGENVAPTSNSIPTMNAKQQLLELEFGYSKYVNFQTVTIQEMPERAPYGQLPRSVDVILDYDLVDKVKAGDRIRVYGLFKPIAPTAAVISGYTRSVILCNNIEAIKNSNESRIISPATMREMKKFSKRKDCFDVLASSVAPSIRGHDYIKKALILQMIGGTEHNLENGIHLRGDINILLVGDPSCGKSQLLRFVLNTMPLAVNTTGRGSSGVGLTAAVVKDEETGERRLEAGAMVLADGGIVCIDEFDKMGEADRVAIHEVMEQQTVTIAKAGIHCSLNARCSVLAAANPVYGQYDISKRPQDNVGLPDSLLSRFDLLFIVRDEMDAEKDRDIAEHVLQMHRYIRPGHENIPEVEDHYDEEKKASSDEMFVKGFGKEKGDKKTLLTISFLKHYIDYAKSKTPVLSDDASDYLVEEYTLLRQKQDAKTLPITARLLETLIRLSTAHAKLRLADSVELEDAKAAMNVINFALYNDAAPVKKQKKEKSTQEFEVIFSDEEKEEAGVSKKAKTSEAASGEKLTETKETKETKETTESTMEEEEEEKEELNVDETLYNELKGKVSKYYAVNHAERLTFDEIYANIAEPAHVSKDTLMIHLSKMVDEYLLFKNGEYYYRV